MTEQTPEEIRANIEFDSSEIDMRPKAKVFLMRFSGKYYTNEHWRIPTEAEIIEAGGTAGDAFSPYVMRWSPDFRRIGQGSVYVPTQEPWGYPHLIMPEAKPHWELYRIGALTASGLDEIIATAQYRHQILKIAEVLGIRLGARRMHEIRRVK